jgi:hypothetical protein
MVLVCFLGFQALILAETLGIVFSYADSHHKLFALAVSIIVQIALTKRVANEIFVPYLFPQIRWWESNLGISLLPT